MEHQFFEGRKFYQDKRTGYWISTTLPKKRMHLVVWEYFNGPVPKGYHIHHIDENKSNNSIENLSLMSSHDHLSLHMTPEKRERSRKWCEEIRPLTKKWHASKEGENWHRKHGIECWNNRIPFTSKCQICEKIFETKTYHQIFCSNACKSRYRRASGLDDIDIICKICSKEFRANKYAKISACSRKCGALLRESQKHQKS